MDLKRFLPGAQSEQQTDHDTLRESTPSAAEEYRAIISNVLDHAEVSSCTDFDVHAVGDCEDGRPIFICAIRLIVWQREPAFRLLLGLPLIEKNIRKNVATHWLNEVSVFGGMWLHASSKLERSTAASELRQALELLTAA